MSPVRSHKAGRVVKGLGCDGEYYERNRIGIGREAAGERGWRQERDRERETSWILTSR